MILNGNLRRSEYNTKKAMIRIATDLLIIPPTFNFFLKKICTQYGE
jgi:hypothetical protein